MVVLGLVFGLALVWFMRANVSAGRPARYQIEMGPNGNGTVRVLP
jgi:hypothetical protein